jgi:hypothetical protein
MKRFLIFLPALAISAAALAAGPEDTTPPSGTVTAATVTPLTFVGTAVGTGADSEPDAVQGVNKSTFYLKLNGTQASYAGKVISVSLDWLVPTNDYDLYIHHRKADGSDGALVHSSGNGAPETHEGTSINPSVNSEWIGIGGDPSGEYNINIVYFATAPLADQPTGTVTVVTPNTVYRAASYTPGGMTFSPNTPLRAPTAYGDSEPSSRIDPF